MPVSEPKASPSPAPRATIAWAIVALALAGVVSYHNSFSGPLVFDDLASITENPTLRDWSPIWKPLIPPRGDGITVEGRPVLNLSLALNYAAGGLSVTGYHLVNLCLHLAVAIVLFDLVRQTLLTPRLRPRYGRIATGLAFSTALLWAVHPLPTVAVTYIIQRAESLVSLFYVLTLYCFRRGVFSPRPIRWLILAALCCLAGMGTKEIMVSAPLLVFLYDRAFISGSSRQAWQNHRHWHLALACTYLLLTFLVVQTGNRGGTAGINVTVTWWKYALTELVSVSNYLKLCFWPNPLVFDYGTEWFTSPAVLVPAGLLIGGLLMTTFVALRKNSPAAVPAVLFFAILAPTSSVLPGIRQTSAEQRMYLPLAAVILVSVAGFHRLLAGRSQARRDSWAPSPLGHVAIAVAAGAFAVLTIQRNKVYRSEYTLFADTVAKRPRNFFAQYNLGKNLAEAGHPAEALAHYQAAAGLRPDLAYIRNNYANALFEAGRGQEAIEQYRAAVGIDPRYATAWYNLGNTLIQLGDKAGAVEALTKAVQFQPDQVEALDNLGSVLFDLGRLDEARTRYEAALKINPRLPEAHVNLGNLLAMQGEKDAARTHFQEALRLAPGFSPAREGLMRVGEAGTK